MDPKMFTRMEAMINSMTPKERRNPDAIVGSRKRRITLGSGTQVQDLNRLLKQHKQMQKMMKKMKGGGLERMMRGMAGNQPKGAVSHFDSSARKPLTSLQSGFQSR
jgi:signal recognition particle subunit FFH/SRP54 (srp54)